MFWGQSNTIHLVVFASLCLTGALPDLSGQAVAQMKAITASTRTQAQPATAPQATEHAIELPEIVNRAEELNLLLRAMTERLGPDPFLDSIDQLLRTQDELIRVRRRGVYELIAGNPTLVELQELEQDWQAKYNQYASWGQTLTERVKAVEEDVRTLTDQQAQWEATLTQIKGADEIKAAIDRIRKSLHEILATKTKASERLTLLVTLQNRVSQQAQAVTDVLGDIRQAKARLQRGLVERDALPLWEVHSRRQTEQSLDIPLRRSLSSAVIRAREFLGAKHLAIAAILAFFLAILSVCVSLSHKALRRAPGELGAAVHLLQHPFSLALLTMLTIALPFTANLPILIRNLLAVLFVVPILRFLPPLIHRLFRPLLYLLVVFGLTVWIWEMLAIPIAVQREVSAGLSLVAIALGAWLIRPARIRRLQPYDRRVLSVITGTYAVLAFFIGSLLANVLGYVAFSRVLRSGAILSAFFAIALYTAYIVAITIFSLFWRTRRGPWLSSTRMYGEMVAKWGLRLLTVIAFSLWLYATLSFFSIRESVMGALSSVLTTPIKWGAVNFSLRDVLTFVLVLVLGVILANIIRVILRTDILVRLPLKHAFHTRSRRSPIICFCWRSSYWRWLRQAWSYPASRC
jgi:potassium-dependent mechanosensitive channel